MLASTIAPVSVAAAVAAFDRWAARRMGAFSYPLPTLFVPSDDRTPPTDRPFVPSVQEEWEAGGYDLGRAGILTTAEAAHPDATPRDLLVAAFNHYEGQHAGYARFTREAGHAAGLDGRGDALPRCIPSRFASAFELGHSAGIADRRERGECLADYHQQLAVEAEEDERERDLQHQAREAGGWDRIVARSLA